MRSPPSSNATRSHPAAARAVAMLLLSIVLCGSASSAFSGDSCVARRHPRSTPSSAALGPVQPPSRRRPRGSATSINTSGDQTQSTRDSVEVGAGEERRGHPVQIRHQGHVATITVHEDEPILQALERQSTISQNRPNDGESDESVRQISSLAMSHIPHECRRGNCLTCSSRIAPKSNTDNIQPNVNNGLSNAISSELTNSGYVLTCCSYVTGPGVVLELDQNDEVWDVVYRRRICPSSQDSRLAAQARLLRRVDEENIGKWKKKMETILDSEDCYGE